MSAVEILAEASWVVEGSYSSARRMTNTWWLWTSLS